MELRELWCRQFRCLDELVFRPLPGVNVIRGHNAQGKTSVLEAVLYVATSKSHRTTAEQNLAAYGSEEFHVRAHVARVVREVTLEAHWRSGAKRFKVNGVAQTRISDILGKVCVVLFTPEDIQLVKGGASVRRQFLDMELSQVSPHYLAALQRYRQVLRQRNELLRASQIDEALLEVWDAQLVRHGQELVHWRAEYVAELACLAREAYGALAVGEEFDIRYSPDIGVEADYAAVIERARAGDVRRRVTERGPHRDDLELLIDGRAARSYGSQGQQKSAALAIKLADTNLVKRRLGEYPVLMLDEVMSELDERRAAQLFSAFDPEIQCIVTTTDLSGRKDRVGNAAAEFIIEGGRLVQD